MESYPVTILGKDYIFLPAVCSRADVGFQREGLFLGVTLSIEGEGWGTCAPGITLDTYDSIFSRRVGTAYGCEFIMQVLTALGVDNFRDVSRRPVDVLYDGKHPLGQTMKGFRCRKMYGGSGEWLVWSEIIDPSTRNKVQSDS